MKPCGSLEEIGERKKETRHLVYNSARIYDDDARTLFDFLFTFSSSTRLYFPRVRVILSTHWLQTTGTLSIIWEVKWRENSVSFMFPLPLCVHIVLFMKIIELSQECPYYKLPLPIDMYLLCTQSLEKVLNLR